MRISNNIHNIALLDEAEVVQEYIAEEKVPVGPSPPKGKEDQQKYEMRKGPKKQVTKLTYKSSSYSIGPKFKQKYTDLENKIMEEDL